MFKKLAVCALLCFALKGKVILWDLGDVLVKNDKIGIAWTIGPSHFLRRLFLDWRSPLIQERLFETLTALDTDPANFWQGRMPDGSKLPPIMSSWMAGKTKGSAIVEQFDTHFNKPENHSFFISDHERNLLRRTIEISFDADILAANTHLIEEALPLFKACKDSRDEHGNPHTHIVLSNWDPSAFTLFYERNEQFFEQFDGIVVSGFIGLIKPHKEIYEYVLRAYNLDPKECIFIDDQKANVEAAQDCGIKSILFKRYDYEDLRSQLVEVGIL